jgi:hypothetical protein
MNVAQSKHNQPKVTDLEEVPHHYNSTNYQALAAQNLTPWLLKPDAYIYTYLSVIVCQVRLESTILTGVRLKF